ncbi:hypothetical protein RRG08_032890 [Elysia crispata]|uniref:Uncharacterized protein n=1 Tax=Elysia crispata TaxID=231223 RepID=A0AAE1AMM9_9GAST|nr:hypothetical protein RRG08_032890 [Elysia crispata]
MQEAAYALYTIVADSEENKHAVVEDHGLDDLVHAAHEGTILCQHGCQHLFGLIFLPEIRAQIASRNTPTQALVQLCKTNDPDTLRFSLQSLEVLAIESAGLICAQVGKVLLYYAENRETCEQLLSHTQARDTLDLFGKTRDAILQKVTVKIIFCCLEYPDLKAKAKHAGMKDVLQYIRDHAADKETWDMAEQSLQLYSSPDDLSGLPTLSTLEKLSKMESKQGKLSGSQSSLGSNTRKDAI